MVLRGLNCRGCCFFERFCPIAVFGFGCLGFFNSGPARPPEAPPGKACGLCALGVGRGCAGLGFGAGLRAHRLAREREAVVVLHQPVEHRVSNRGVPNPFVPVLDRQLTGNDDGK